jgi:hypothetical protein
MTGTAKVFTFVAVGCGLLVVGGAVVAVLGLSWIVREPTGVEVLVETPLQVALDQRFQMVTVIKNTGPKSLTVVDVDVANSYLEGVVVQSSQPPFRDAMHVPIDETISHSFDQTVEPGSELRVTFEMVAVHPGDFAGDVDFCIDSELRCISYPVRTLVRP